MTDIWNAKHTHRDLPQKSNIGTKTTNTCARQGLNITTNINISTATPRTIAKEEL